MDIYKDINIEDCPFCRGAGLLEEEGDGWYVVSADCGSQTAIFEYSCPDERIEAAQTAARIWNMGKVSKMGAGE